MEIIYQSIFLRILIYKQCIILSASYNHKSLIFTPILYVQVHDKMYILCVMNYHKLIKKY